MLAGLDSSYCHFNGSSEYQNLDCGNKPSSYVVSVSYGGYDEPVLQEQACAEFGKVRSHHVLVILLQRVLTCSVRFLQLSLQGMTFLFSSGDSGVASAFQGQCVLPNGTLSSTDGYFFASWPASCPYVTAVGATEVLEGKTVRCTLSGSSCCLSCDTHLNPPYRVDERPRVRVGRLPLRRRLLERLPAPALADARGAEVPEQLRARLRAGPLQRLKPRRARRRRERLEHHRCGRRPLRALLRHVRVRAHLRVDDHRRQRRAACGRQGARRLY